MSVSFCILYTSRSALIGFVTSVLSVQTWEPLHGLSGRFDNAKFRNTLKNFELNKTGGYTLLRPTCVSARVNDGARIQWSTRFTVNALFPFVEILQTKRPLQNGWSKHVQVFVSRRRIRNAELIALQTNSHDLILHSMKLTYKYFTHDFTDHSMHCASCI